jgi:hypothetical protein
MGIDNIILMNRKTAIFRADLRQMQFGYAELPKATGNRQQATGNRQLYT